MKELSDLTRKPPITFSLKLYSNKQEDNLTRAHEMLDTATEIGAPDSLIDEIVGYIQKIEMGG